MADKDQDYRIFVGGLSWDVTERQLESAFNRFGKIVDCQADAKGSSLLEFGKTFVGEVCVERFHGHVGESFGSFISLKEEALRGWLILFLLCCLKCNNSHKLKCIHSVDSCSHIMLERDTGRPRGFGFLTFADRRSMEDAITDMHGREFGDRVISVNKAQPKMAGEEPGHGHGGYSSGGRGSYGGGDRSTGQDDCFKCGRPGHWARDCPSAGGGRGARPFSPPRSRYGGGGGRGDRYAGDRDRYMDDRHDRGRYGDRDRYDSRDDRYVSRDRYVTDRYPPAADRFPVDRYGASDRYPQTGYGKDRAYDRDGGPTRGGSDRYGGGAPPARYEGRSFRDRPGPYDRPRRGGRVPSVEHY